MFRYKIALPISFTGQMPIIEIDDPNDMPLHAQGTVTLAHDCDFNLGGGSMHLSAGTQVSGIIVGKQNLNP